MAAPRIVPLRRNRDFTLLWSGQVVSTIGTSVSGLAFPLLVLALTRSPMRAGIVGFAQTIPFLILYLPAGALVDRWNRKRVMLFADAVRAAALGSVATALAVGWLTFMQLIVVAFIEGSLFVFFQLSESAALPHLVMREQLPAAIAQNQAREQGAALVGQPLGGALFGLSHLLPFAADAISYGVSFMSLLFVRPSFQEERPPQPAHLIAEVAEGIAWLWRHPLLRSLVLLIGASNFALAALPLVMIVRARQLGASSALIGAMFALLGGAGIAGALIAPLVQTRLATRWVIVGSLWLWACGIAGLMLPRNVPAIGAVAAVIWLTGPSFNVVVNSYRYALAPDRLQARTQSAARLVTWGTIPLGALAGGALVEGLGPRSSLLVLAGVSLAAAITATLLNEVRNAPEVAELLAGDAVLETTSTAH